MRNPPPSQSTPNTWIGHKDLGKAQFERREYLNALASYRAALNPEYGIPTAERQVILSNVVACRLKIGGAAQAEAAVEEAKQCIAMNPSWAKAHIRLASAYIELGGHSNDACNELQRALALDPGNPTARQMLMRELRRDHQHPIPSAPPEEEDDSGGSNVSPQNSHSIPNDYSESNRGTTAPPPDDDVDDPLRDNTIDDSPSWPDRIKFHIYRVVAWYEGQSEDTKTVFKVIVGILILYVAFGGRFGLDTLFGNNHENRGNYERGNAYDRYYGRTVNGNYESNSEQRRNPYGNYHNDNEYQYRPNQSRRRSGRSSFGFSNLFDGSFTSMLCVGGIVYLCHKNNVNPFTALMMINAVGGNRGRGMRHMGLAGLGYGAVRGAYGRRRRQNGWY